MILPLARKNHSVWKQKFKNISQITPEIKKLVSDMKETLELTGGVGLATPQVASPIRLFIIDYAALKEVFINPKITRYGKENSEAEEGCLSVPGARGLTRRSNEVDIEYLDVKGRKKKASLRGYYARIAQHEYDHLSSTFYVDRILDKKKIYTYKPVKIIFFGTPEISVIILRTLIGQQFVGEYSLPLVVTGPDKLIGREKELAPSPVKTLAQEFDIPVSTPTNIKEAKFIKHLKSLEPDFIILASYGKILPKEILEIPKKGALNIHFSLLPKYRGASPVQSSILHGDSYTGVTIIKMSEKLDLGNIIAQTKVKISPKDTALSLNRKLANIGSALVNHVIHLVATGRIKEEPQKSKKLGYTKQIEKKDGEIDWEKPPENLERMIRAYYPWPGVYTSYKGKRLKLLPERKVQLEGKEPVKLEDFKRGYKDFTLEW